MYMHSYLHTSMCVYVIIFSFASSKTWISKALYEKSVCFNKNRKCSNKIYIFFRSFVIVWRVKWNKENISYLHGAYRSSGSAAWYASFPVNFSEEIMHEEISNSVDFFPAIRKQAIPVKWNKWIKKKKKNVRRLWKQVDKHFSFFLFGQFLLCE